MYKNCLDKQDLQLLSRAILITVKNFTNYILPWRWESNVKILVVIGTDCIVICKLSYPRMVPTFRF